MESSAYVQTTPSRTHSITSTSSTDGQKEKKYYRDANCRVFVNRSLHLEKIKFFGFDMDYTLAEYESPQYETLAFNLLRARLIDIGYPEEIAEFQYDPTFPIRGLWFDKQYGNLLKMDGFGNILVCLHGFRFLKVSEIEQRYPNKFLQLDDNRVYVMNTLFSLPELYMMACIIDMFSSSPNFITEIEGVKSGQVFMSYKSIFQDIRGSLDYIHTKGTLKQETVRNISHYVRKDSRLPLLLNRLRDSGAKVFLLTNSEYWYTSEIMGYLLNGDEQGTQRNWRSYFDYIIVDGCKPAFFSDGTLMRLVNTETGRLQLGTPTGDILKGRVYSGGCCDIFTELIGAKGKDVLYVGDHIFGDIVKSKKVKGWRTFLVVPELFRELHVWTDKRNLFDELQHLDVVLGDLYRHLDSSNKERPDLKKIRSDIRECSHRMDLSYGLLGSLFRSGSRLTHFSSQVMRFADLYGATLLNLINYPFSYMFRAPPMLMAHESTVDHEESTNLQPIENKLSVPVIPNPGPKLSDTSFTVPHTRAEVPNKITHHHDEDDSEDDSDKSTLEERND